MKLMTYLTYRLAISNWLQGSLLKYNNPVVIAELTVDGDDSSYPLAKHQKGLGLAKKKIQRAGVSSVSNQI
jgi:hypothetical protein